MCQCDTYDPCPGLLFEKKRPRVRKGRTDKGDVFNFYMYVLYTGKSGSLSVSANEGS